MADSHLLILTELEATRELDTLMIMELLGGKSLKPVTLFLWRNGMSKNTFDNCPWNVGLQPDSKRDLSLFAPLPMTSRKPEIKGSLGHVIKR